MRIIAGKFKRRLLKYPKDDLALRPTKDMVKEAVFSIIQKRLPECRFLDLFAGVGSIGLEAVSRGAEEVVMIDLNPRYIYENVEALGLTEEVKVYRNDALRALEILGSRGEKFDIIYLDPPYETKLVEDSLKKIVQLDILKPGGIIIVETKRTKKLITELNISLERLYGQTKVYVLEKPNV